MEEVSSSGHTVLTDDVEGKKHDAVKKLAHFLFLPENCLINMRKKIKAIIIKRNKLWIYVSQHHIF